MILNIETSQEVCSVALTDEGALYYQMEESTPMRHAEALAPMVKKTLDEMRKRDKTLTAVAVSIGPGSYTGLRIGLSEAKGIAYGYGVPLIGVSTLEAMAVKVLFHRWDLQGDELLVPMMDARRMEVYTAVYDAALNPVMAPQPLILTGGTPYGEVIKRYPGRRILLFGSGMAKSRDILASVPGMEFVEMDPLTAPDLMALSEKAFREQRFLDLAYSEPEYLKAFQATAPKRPF